MKIGASLPSSSSPSSWFRAKVLDETEESKHDVRAHQDASLNALIYLLVRRLATYVRRISFSNCKVMLWLRE